VSIYPRNDEKFDAARALNLPLGRYAITSSGPLGIRDIREISDIDIIVDNELWQVLSARFGTVTEGEVTKIRPNEVIEVFSEASFLVPSPGAPTASEQIAAAELVDGLPFVCLEHILYFKELMLRDKDLADIVTLKRLLGREDR
jgi:hypothetical protein